MKKILLATTVLTASAGFAAADVAVSGSARMGVVSYYNSDSDKNATTFSSRVQASFSGSGTTDGGLAFGGSFDMHNAGDADGGTSGSTYISGAFGKISMGGVDSGDKAAVGQLSSVGYEGLGSGNSISYTADGGLLADSDDIEGADGAKVLYTYSAGDLAVSVSSAQLSNGAHNHQAYGLGVAYTAGAMTLAVGYGSNEVEGIACGDGDCEGTGTITDLSASVKYAMGDTTIKAIYQEKSADISLSWNSEDYDLGSATSMGVSVDHKIDALTLTAYAITTDIQSDWSEVDASVNRMGVGATYDLGGGAKFQAGWAQMDAADGDDETHSAFDAGVNFSF